MTVYEILHAAAGLRQLGLGLHSSTEDVRSVPPTEFLDITGASVSFIAAVDGNSKPWMTLNRELVWDMSYKWLLRLAHCKVFMASPLGLLGTDTTAVEESVKNLQTRVYSLSVIITDKVNVGTVLMQTLRRESKISNCVFAAHHASNETHSPE
ncbi:hypothetical protein K438DRAFT_1755016 [Mycena galopus ATCC 62051]|nr:hypothetical protein K438DRAFT_1755016 [Mycena galopus ATCC 62051]